MRVHSRRFFLKILAFTLSYPPLSSFCFAFPAQLPESVSEKGLTYDEFMALSRFITGLPNLDENVESQHIYRLIMQEPWGPENLNRVYGRVRELQQCAGYNKKPILHKSNFSHNNQWFISHLLVTWYTGAYYHDKGNEFITIKNALMYKIQSAYRQPPTYCSGKTGFWVEPPNTHKTQGTKAL